MQKKFLHYLWFSDEQKRLILTTFNFLSPFLRIQCRNYFNLEADKKTQWVELAFDFDGQTTKIEKVKTAQVVPVQKALNTAGFTVSVQNRHAITNYLWLYAPERVFLLIIRGNSPYLFPQDTFFFHFLEVLRV